MSHAMRFPADVSRQPAPWTVRNIVVIGPGIVGMPMAAMLAHARVCIGSREPAHVTVIQRRSPSSGWKIDAINAGRSPIGGVEPALADIVRDSVADGLLRATDAYAVCRDADAIVVCVQTDRLGDGPDYGPLLESLRALARELALRQPGNAPLIVIESTLAPSSLHTIVREVFRDVGLEDGRDIHLGHSPNRVMPGRLVDRVASADKLVSAFDAVTNERIALLYRHIVTRGTLHLTNALTAELAKTLENAYRDVRIALAAELARYCDAHDVDFYALREWVNAQLLQTDLASFQPGAVPRGGLLVPTLGVGGHCLPKDGILLWWRAAELGLSTDNSLILEARRINDESPLLVRDIAERALGGLQDRSIALLGASYRFNSDDARNSPTFTLAHALARAGSRVRMHDPFVRSDDTNLRKAGLTHLLTADLSHALADADLAVVCVAHRTYVDDLGAILRAAPRLRAVIDVANVYDRRVFDDSSVLYAGIGRGSRQPPIDLCNVAYDAFRVVERGVANEVAAIVDVLNAHYAADDFARVRFEQLQQLVGTCATGCAIAEPGRVVRAVNHGAFASRLVTRAVAAAAPSALAPLDRRAAAWTRTRVRLSDR